MRIIKLPFRVKKETLACGADLKGGFCFAKGGRAYMSEGFGDLSQADNAERYEREIGKAERTLRIKPKVIACDLHPGYISTKFARHYHEIRDTRHEIRYVQHHHAHIAACMVDHKIKGKVIGVSFDGTGFGTDGNIWGGEILLSELGDFKRLFHLDYAAMPGGEAAIREPWRMALSYIYKTYGGAMGRIKIPFLKRIGCDRVKVLTQMIKGNINSPLTSSMGRFFDGISSVIGVKDTVKYEAEAAIELERIADFGCRGKYRYRASAVKGIVEGVVGDLKRGEEKSVISSKFHNTIAHMVKDLVIGFSSETGTDKVVFSGGVFQNRYLVARLKEIFKGSRLKVYFHNDFATTDASIALGQIAIANSI